MKPLHEKTNAFAYVKTKAQISFAVTAKLISAFVFVTQLIQSLYFLNTKVQASSYLLSLQSPVCVRPGRKPKLFVLSRDGSIIFSIQSFHFLQLKNPSILHGWCFRNEYLVNEVIIGTSICSIFWH